MSTQEKGKHGGARPGSGRKPTENKRVQMSVTVSSKTRDEIKSYCKQNKIRFGRVLDDLVTKEIISSKTKTKEETIVCYAKPRLDPHGADYGFREIRIGLEDNTPIGTQYIVTIRKKK